jgi:hypothetical protein
LTRVRLEISKLEAFTTSLKVKLSILRVKSREKEARTGEVVSAVNIAAIRAELLDMGTKELEFMSTMAPAVTERKELSMLVPRY